MTNPLLDSDGVYWGKYVMLVGPVSSWSAQRKALVIKFNGTTGSIDVSKFS